MLKLLQSIFGPISDESDRIDETLIEKATERVVDGTDPRLRALTGYRKSLRPAVKCSVDYILKFVEHFPPAIELSHTRCSEDPRVRAFFSAPKRMYEEIRKSKAITSYVAQNQPPASGMICAALGVDWKERTMLGVDLDGDILRRDVAQKVINFSNHRFVVVTDNEAATRDELAKRGFDHLIQAALRKIANPNIKQDELAQERQLLQQKRQAMKGAQWGLNPVIDSGETEQVDIHATEKRIVEIEKELVSLHSKIRYLDDYLSLIASTLNSPQDYLQMGSVFLSLNHMGIKSREASDTTEDTVELKEIVVGDRRVIGLLANIPWDEVEKSQRH